jgi:phage terminase small subunit
MTGNLLTPKQQSFVDQYLIDLNATQAAIRAGYSEKTATVQASRLLTNVKVQAALAKGRQELADQAGISQERVLKEYAKLAFLDIRKAFDDAGNLKQINELDDDTAAAISGIEVEKRILPGTGDSETRLHKIKLSDKKGALDSLARHLGMFVDKKEITGNPLININLMSLTEQMRRIEPEAIQRLLGINDEVIDVD